LGPELAAVLGRLSADERDALLLYACAELTYDQIGRATGVPIGTVRSRIHRARTRVRAHLATLELCHEH
jgi:RNA polymerase sigma-70 factor (ECF subfamily)